LGLIKVMQEFRMQPACRQAGNAGIIDNS
jgi:hypothetical protein